ncbi:MAG: hypothetical protein ACR2M4_00175 [Actinomycetota bacterium]
MVIRRWVNPDLRRYYIAAVTDDLFGGWNLVRYGGGSDSRRGGQLSEHLADAEDIETHLRVIAERRQKRGYVPAPV